MDLAPLSFILAGLLTARVWAEVKTWLPNTNFGNPRNWDAGRAPCSADRAVFPPNVELGVSLPGGSTAVRELVLPLSGEIMLPLQGRLAVTGYSRPQASCPDPSDAVFSRRQPEEWLLPRNWRSQDDNPAAPHAYRVPCEHDSTVFPPDSSFGVRLPQEPVIVRQLSLHGEDTSSEDWTNFLLTEAGERQFVAPEESRQMAVAVTGSAPCDHPSGCSCVSGTAQREVCRLQEPLCGPPPSCFSAVRPLGHCCDVCGAYLLLDYNDHFRLADLKLSVEKLLGSKDFSGLASHVGKTAGTDQIQVVIVDRGDYTGAPGNAARQLAVILEKSEEAEGVTKVEVHVAGPASYAGGVGAIMGNVFGPLLGVIVVLGLFYLVFVVYGDKQLLSLSPSGGGSFVFARFDNSPEEAAHDETALEAMEAARVHVAVPTPKPANAFDNPMFGKTSAPKAAAAPPQRRQATQENPVFLEMHGHQSSTSEDTAEEELLSSQDEDEDTPSASQQ